MAWGSESGRTVPLPENWSSIRLEVLKRDKWLCRWKLPSGAQCPRRATDVDHMGEPDDHRLFKLRSLCSHHHAKVTAQQGVAGRARRKQPRKRDRRQEKHPGRLT